jgi:hypothetical protein
MIVSEAFVLLNIEQGSSAEEIRKAWRLKSTVHHPDAGGSNEAMVSLNLALEMALEWKPDEEGVGTPATAPVQSSSSVHSRRDISSFTVNVLPVECWQGLEIVAALCGPTVLDEPPYLLEFLLHDSSLPHTRDGWCRCECVPEAGGTTVHLTVGSSHGSTIPNIDDVRDFLVEQLNHIDWPG